MNEPMPGQKTSYLAGVFVLLQAAQAAGFVDPEMARLLEQFLALGMTVTLALKARRAQKGK